jgi:hypothetical protein
MVTLPVRRSPCPTKWSPARPDAHPANAALAVPGEALSLPDQACTPPDQTPATPGSRRSPCPAQGGPKPTGTRAAEARRTDDTLPTHGSPPRPAPHVSGPTRIRTIGRPPASPANRPLGHPSQPGNPGGPIRPSRPSRATQSNDSTAAAPPALSASRQPITPLVPGCPERCARAQPNVVPLPTPAPCPYCRRTPQPDRSLVNAGRAPRSTLTGAEADQQPDWARQAAPGVAGVAVSITRISTSWSWRSR